MARCGYDRRIKAQRLHQNPCGSQQRAFFIGERSIAHYYRRYGGNPGGAELTPAERDGLGNVRADVEHEQGDTVNVLCEDTAGVEH